MRRLSTAVLALLGVAFAAAITSPESSGRGASLHQLWRHSRTDNVPFANGVAVDDVRVFVGSGDGTLSALDAASGVLLWRSSTGSFGAVATPTVVGDSVVAGNAAGNLTAYDVASGDGRWVFNVPNHGANTTRDAVAFDGFVFWGTAGSSAVVAVNVTNGAYAWSNFLYAQSSVPSFANGMVYFAVVGGVFQVEPATGSIRDAWTLPGAYVDVAPVVGNGTAWLASNDGSVYRYPLEPRDADPLPAPVWRFDAGGAVGPLALVGGVLYFAAVDAVNLTETRHFAVCATTGALRWRRSLRGSVALKPAIDGELAYVASGNALYALDAATGDVQAAFIAMDEIRSAPVVVKGTVFVAATHSIYAVTAFV